MTEKAKIIEAIESLEKEIDSMQASLHNISPRLRREREQELAESQEELKRYRENLAVLNSRQLAKYEEGLNMINIQLSSNLLDAPQREELEEQREQHIAWIKKFKAGIYGREVSNA